jgi:hypothetical protein
MTMRLPRHKTRWLALFPKEKMGPHIHDNNAGLDSSVFHKDPHDVTMYTKLCIQFDHTARGMDENNEDFFLEYSSSNGDVGTWDLVKQFVAGADFPCCINDNPSSNVTYTDSVELDSADFLFTSGAKIGFRCSAWLWSGNGDYIYVDQVSFEGFRPNP